MSQTLSGQYKLHVEQLGYSNWPTWSTRMKDVLMREGLWGAVNPIAGEQLCVPDQHKALGLLRMHVDDSVRGDLERDELNSADKVWKHLEDQYKRTAGVQRFQLRDEWHTMRQEEGEPVAAYATRVKLKAGQVKAVGVRVDEEEAAMTLVRGLSEEYALLRTLARSDPTMAGSIDAIVPRLLLREQELKEDVGADTFSFAAVPQRARLQRRQLGIPAPQQQRVSAGAGRGGQRGGRNGRGGGAGRGRVVEGFGGQLRPDIQCRECGNWGHFGDRCPTLGAGGGKGAGGGGGAGKGGRGSGRSAGPGKKPVHGLAAVAPGDEQPAFGFVSMLEFDPKWTAGRELLSGIG